MRWLDDMNGYYPPRFKTLLAAQKALYNGDFSGQELPFEVKDDGKTVMLRQEYKDAHYEIQWLTRDGGIRQSSNAAGELRPPLNNQK